MPQRRNILFLPICSHCLLRHHVKIPVFQLDHCTLSNCLPLQEPLVLNRFTLPRGQTDGNHFLSLTISMKPNPAFRHVIVIISLRSQFLSPLEIFSKIFSESRKQGNRAPGYNSTFPLLIIWLLSIIAKAQVMTCMLRDNSAIHKCFGIPFKSSQLMEQRLLIFFNCIQQALSPPFHNQNAGILSLFLRKLVKVHKDALISLLFKESLSFSHFCPGKTSLSWSSNDLHSFVILSLVPKGNSNRTHLYISFQ